MLEGTGGMKERRREGYTAVERLVLPLDCSAHFCKEGAGSLKATPSRLPCQMREAFLFSPAAGDAPGSVSSSGG